MKIQGFIPPEQIAPEEWVLGASNTPVFPVLKEDGNWEEYLPTEERQNIRNIETYNCTGFNTLNAIEMLVYKLTGKRDNYSDRWVGIIAKTKAPGNDPHKVAEAIREYGLVKEESLPFSDDIKDINEYYSFKGLTQGQIDALYEEAKQWKKTYDFKHSWVFTPGQPILEQINNIKIALKNSPLAVAVYAWASDNRNVYYSLGQENHWTNIYNVSDFIKVFDSYPPFKKDIEQTLRYCKRYSVTLRTEITEEERKGLLALLQKALEWLGLIQKQVEALPKVDNSVEVKPEEVYNEVKETLMEKYDWSTPQKARHSVRVICDEEGLSVKDKNDLCATIGGESGWKPNAIGKPNFDGTRDYGIVQVNEKYWIGEGKLFPSKEYVLANPEACVRWMCKEWKKGNKNWWYAYKNGSYKKFL